MLPAESSLRCSEGTEIIGVIGIKVKNGVINQQALLKYNYFLILCLYRQKF